MRESFTLPESGFTLNAPQPLEVSSDGESAAAISPQPAKAVLREEAA